VPPLERPFATIARGVTELGPGDALNLRHGVYVEPVVIASKHGKAEEPIVIRAHDAEAVYVDGSLVEFRGLNNDDWVPANTVDDEAVEDEYVSATTFAGDLVNRGAFLDRNPYTRLVTYSNINDLRAENETFHKIVNENEPRPGRRSFPQQP
jgi:Chondroitinase B